MGPLWKFLHRRKVITYRHSIALTLQQASNCLQNQQFKVKHFLNFLLLITFYTKEEHAILNISLLRFSATSTLDKLKLRAILDYKVCNQWKCTFSDINGKSLCLIIQVSAKDRLIHLNCF